MPKLSSEEDSEKTVVSTSDEHKFGPVVYGTMSYHM